MGNEVQEGTQVPRQAKGRVMSVRLDDEMLRRVKSYAASTEQSESAAVRELIARGLAADGLGLYGDEVADLIRSVMAGTLAEMDRMLEKRNDEHEDRIARVVARSAKMASLASIASVDMLKALYPGLRDVPSEKIWDSYAKRAGEMQAGKKFGEALRHASQS